RDFHVTGVQTCALPILAVVIAALAAILGACNGNGENGDPTALPSPRMLLDDATNQISSASSFTIEISVSGLPVRIQVVDIALPEIGRASCREREENVVV